jgi:hypothetical protein
MGARPIGNDVTSLATKLLVLLAVLLMPLGMAMAATTAHHEHAAASMPVEHCPDRAPQHDMKGGLAACTMACSSALPAADLSRSEPPPAAYVPAAPSVIMSLHGIHPDTATPPPKLS